MPQRRRRKRLGASTTPNPPTADAPNVVWAVDFQFDATTDGRPIKIVSIVDEHTRECLGGLVERNITGRHLIDELDPSQSASVAWWYQRAAACCREIAGRGKRVLIIGGTPLYLKTLLCGLFDGPPADRDAPLRGRPRNRRSLRDPACLPDLGHPRSCKGLDRHPALQDRWLGRQRGIPRARREVFSPHRDRERESAVRASSESHAGARHATGHPQELVGVKGVKIRDHGLGLRRWWARQGSNL